MRNPRHPGLHDAKGRELPHRLIEIGGVDTYVVEGGAPDGPFPVFRIDVTEAMTLRPAGDHLVIETWHEGRGMRRIERR